MSTRYQFETHHQNQFTTLKAINGEGELVASIRFHGLARLFTDN